MLSGQDAHGADATNGLSHLVLDAAEDLRLLDPKIGVRLHQGSPPELIARCAELIAGKLNGFPTIYNDEVIIPMLTERAGITTADAFNYCNDGCAELQISGESDFYPVWGRIGFLKLLAGLLASGRPYHRFEELMGDYRISMTREIEKEVREGNEREQRLARISPVPFLSGTFESCVQSGLDKTRGGARYNHTGFLGMELPDAANALMGIRRAVFEEERVTLEELRAVMAEDFQGREDLRLYLRNRVPKYGNDEDCVDSLLQELAGAFCDEVLRHANSRGGRYLPGFFDFGNFVVGARGIGATPDGRHAGEACAVHLSPAVGTDRSGATAALKSFARACRSRPPLGAIMDLKFHPSAVAGREGHEKLVGFIRAFLDLGCVAEQTNVLDVETLRDAQLHPENYRDLMVRVWGFSAYFTDLSPEFQEHVIRRTEHAL
jgi:formate C-acetyltransferase